MGCEVTVELPLNWYEDNSFLGFAFFFHHVPFSDDECENRDYGISKCELTTS